MPPENNVQFEGESSQSAFRSRVILGQMEVPKMIRFMIGKGIVKDEKTAGNILVGMAIAFVVLAIIIIVLFVFRFSFSSLPTTDEALRNMGI